VRIGGWKGSNFHLDNGSKLPAFAPEPGSITYVGNLSFEIATKSIPKTGSSEMVMVNFLSSSMQWDPDKAKNYIKKNYPHFAPLLKFRPLEFKFS
jgi:hypothetical protein